MSLPKLGTHVFGSCAKARHRAPAWFSSIVLPENLRVMLQSAIALQLLDGAWSFGKPRHTFPDHAL